MADNFGTPIPSNLTFAADEVAGILYQRMKLAWGAPDTAVDVSAANPLPVSSAVAAATPATGTFTSVSSVGATIQTAVTGYTAAAVSVNGTYGTGGTFVFEVSDDGGTNWYPITANRVDTAAGETTAAPDTDAEVLWLVAFVGATHLRVRLTGVPASGTMNIRISPVSAGVDPVQPSGGPVTRVDGAVSTANSTTALLGSFGTFTGTAEDLTDYPSVTVNVRADQAANSFTLQFSSDGANWDIQRSYTVLANTGYSFTLPRLARWFRVSYQNTTTAQTAFRLQTVLHPTAEGGSVNAIGNEAIKTVGAGRQEVTPRALAAHPINGEGTAITFARVAVNTAAEASVIAAPTTPGFTRVLGYALTLSALGTVAFESPDNTVIASWDLAAATPLVYSGSMDAPAFDLATATELRIVPTGGTVRGHISYVTCRP